MWENRSSVDKCSAEDMNREILTQKTSGETMHRIPKSRHKDAHADGMVGGTAMTWRCGDMEVQLNTVNTTAWVHTECDIIMDGQATKRRDI